MRLGRVLTLLAPRLLHAFLFFTTVPLPLSTLPLSGIAFALFAPRLLHTFPRCAFPCCATVHLTFGPASPLPLSALSFGAFLAGLDFF